MYACLCVVFLIWIEGICNEENKKGSNMEKKSSYISVSIAAPAFVEKSHQHGK
jgi:hypothetical protein